MPRTKVDKIKYARQCGKRMYVCELENLSDFLIYGLRAGMFVCERISKYQ